MEFSHLNKDQINFIENVFIEPKTNYVLFGGAGTGKSTVLHGILAEYKKRDRGNTVVVLGPTGLSISNIKNAQTISSFLGVTASTVGVPGSIVHNSTIAKRISGVDTIIIDECGMISAGDFSALDTALRRCCCNVPFGGLRLILIGDIFQLQPHDDFFFTTKAWNLLETQTELSVLQLTKVERFDIQDEDEREEFQNLLTSLRLGTFTTNCRAQSLIDYVIGRQALHIDDRESIIHLCATNQVADEINDMFFDMHTGTNFTFVSQTSKKHVLSLKLGIPIQFTQNVYQDGELCAHNGMLGTVVDLFPVDLSASGIKNEKIYLSKTVVWGCTIERSTDGKTITIYSGKLHTKTDTIAVGLDAENNKTRIHLFPIRISYAVTIHKMQGQTLKKAVLVGKEMFAGRAQIYVAFSRMINWKNIFLLDMTAEKLYCAIGKTKENVALQTFIHQYNLK